MRFQVPQFTDVEDKIIGPLSFRQFVYLAGSAGLIVVLFAILPRFLAIVIAIPVAAFGGALAFLKVNSQPFIRVVESFLRFSITNKLYLWKHDENKKVAKAKKPVDPNHVPKLSESKLRDLMWSLDVKQNGNPTGEEER